MFWMSSKQLTEGCLSLRHSVGVASLDLSNCLTFLPLSSMPTSNVNVWQTSSAGLLPAPAGGAGLTWSLKMPNVSGSMTSLFFLLRQFTLTLTVMVWQLAHVCGFLSYCLVEMCFTLGLVWPSPLHCFSSLGSFQVTSAYRPNFATADTAHKATKVPGKSVFKPQRIASKNVNSNLACYSLRKWHALLQG